MKVTALRYSIHCNLDLGVIQIALAVWAVNLGENSAEISSMIIGIWAWKIISDQYLGFKISATGITLWKSHYELINALGYSTFCCDPDLGVLQIGNRAKVIENQGADEEISDRGIPRVIVLGYDGLPMQPVAPPSPDYIPGPEDPQTPPVPQDEDVREPMFIQAHDPDYVPEPIYPEYIPLKDEHELPAEDC
ncbi:hypothetical protein Tco_1343633 [Tanacetum coccineum]